MRDDEEQGSGEELDDPARQDGDSDDRQALPREDQGIGLRYRRRDIASPASTSVAQAQPRSLPSLAG
jgi:hypothetical protein